MCRSHQRHQPSRPQPIPQSLGLAPVSLSLPQTRPYNGLSLPGRPNLTREPAPVLSNESASPSVGSPWGVREVLLGLALPLLVWAIALGLTIAVGEEDGNGVDTGVVIGGLVLTLVLQGILVGLAARLSLGKYRLSWSSLGFRPLSSDLYWAAAAVAIGAHVLVISYAAVVTAAGADALAPQQELKDLFESRAVLPLVGVVTVLTAPLAEETFFRGFVFPGLMRRLGVVGAAVASGLLFAAFHVSSADTAGLVIPFTIIGVALAGLYYYTGSLWSTIGAHFLFNLISFGILAALAGS